jgi:hypothetical protein
MELLMSNDLNEFMKLMAEAKAKDPKRQILKQVKENIKSDLDSLFEQLTPEKSSEPKEKITKSVELIQEVIEEPKTSEERSDDVTKYLSALPKDSHSFQQPIAPSISQDMKVVTDKLKFLEQWVAKISAAGPGGGAGDVINLDHPTTLVTTATYAVKRKDYYVGVNYAGRVTLTLPSVVKDGRYIIIKDESGRCSTYPIVVQGNVDNDPSGFILATNNGAIQMIYRNGWRIV